VKDRVNRACVAVLVFAAVGDTWADQPAEPRREWTAAQLTAQLANPDVEVAIDAANQLSRIGVAAVPLLVKALTDASPQTRRLAGAALGDMAPAGRAALPALEERFTDPDAPVRLISVLAFIRNGGAWTRALPVLEEGVLRTDDQWLIVHVVGSIAELRDQAEAAVPLLERGLAHPDPIVRGAIPRALAAIGPCGWPGLGKALTSKDATLTWPAVRAVRALGTRAASLVPAMAPLLRDVTSLSTEAAWALGEMGDAALPVLITALDDPSLPNSSGATNVRASIASVLGRQGASAAAAVPALSRLLSHPDSYVRYSAAKALAAFGPAAASAAEALRKAESDPDDAVRQAAGEALARIR
jgi:HEAT repeat protein